MVLLVALPAQRQGVVFQSRRLLPVERDHCVATFRPPRFPGSAAS
jgi:hypothetical protein